MKARLPVPCPLEPGESLPGLFSRTVVANNYRSLSSLLYWFGLSEDLRDLNKSQMRHLATGKINIGQLAEFTEHTTEQIESAALRLGHPCPGGKYDEYVSMHRWRYCPVCIQQGKPHQKVWLLPFVTACPEHGCELIDCCHKCGRPHAVNLPMLPYCGSCQTFPKRVTAHPHEVDCSHSICSLMDNEPELKVLLDRLMTAWFLSTSEALRPHFKFSPQLQTVTQMRKRVIQLWSAARNTASLSNAIETQIEDLQHRWPHLPFISTILVNRAKLAGANLPNRDITEKRIKLLQRDDPWWVPQQAAADAAGISSHVIQRLVDKKLVKSRLFSDVGEDGNRHKFRMVNLNAWHTLIRELYDAAIKVEDKTGFTNISMLRLYEVIRDVRNGKMFIYVEKGNTLSDLMVKFDETRTCARRLHTPKGSLTSAEVAKLLGTYHAVVADLVERSILKVSRKTKNHRLLINKDSAESFNSEYILVGTLAKQHGLNCTNLAEKLASFGISPTPVSYTHLRAHET